LILVKAQDAGAKKVFWLEPRLDSKTSRRWPDLRGFALLFAAMPSLVNSRGK
jgi:hypothetical protein